MPTEKQILANRRNAQKSTGPRSIEGKAIVSRNAIKHGLSAVKHVITDEDPRDFRHHRDQLLAELVPLTPLESVLAERLVTLSWRLKRASRLQTQTIKDLNSKKIDKPLENLVQSMMPQHSAPHAPRSTTTGARPNNLGRTIIRDFSDSRVLDRLLMYERRIEHSLFKTILEIQRLNLIRQFTPQNNPQPQQPLLPQP